MYIYSIYILYIVCIYILYIYIHIYIYTYIYSYYIHNYIVYIFSSSKRQNINGLVVSTHPHSPSIWAPLFRDRETSNVPSSPDTAFVTSKTTGCHISCDSKWILAKRGQLSDLKRIYIAYIVCTVYRVHIYIYSIIIYIHIVYTI